MWQWIKFPKIAALACFILPWLTVSCSGREIASASGFGLAFGRINSAAAASDQRAASMNFWLILAIIAISVGIYLSVKHGRESARLVIGTSAAAFLLILIGTHGYSREAILAEASRNGGGGELGQAALAVIDVDWHLGYWITLLALIASGVMAWLVMVGRDDEAEAKMRSMAADLSDKARDVATKVEDAVRTDRDPPPPSPPTAG